MTLYDLTVDVLAAALPDVMYGDTAIEIYGDGSDRLDVPEEWYMTPRQMAAQILENLKPVSPDAAERIGRA